MVLTSILTVGTPESLSVHSFEAIEYCSGTTIGRLGGSSGVSCGERSAKWHVKFSSQWKIARCSGRTWRELAEVVSHADWLIGCKFAQLCGLRGPILHDTQMFERNPRFGASQRHPVELAAGEELNPAKYTCSWNTARQSVIKTWPGEAQTVCQLREAIGDGREAHRRSPLGMGSTTQATI